MQVLKRNSTHPVPQKSSLFILTGLGTMVSRGLSARPITRVLERTYIVQPTRRRLWSQLFGDDQIRLLKLSETVDDCE